MLTSLFCPLVADWFAARFGTPTHAQAEGWPAIAAGTDTLIAAPTGSGKTLAAFLTCINQLIGSPERAGTTVVYVSPLKALSNDVQRNLEQPLVELTALATERGQPFAPIRVAVRTGDTPMTERRRMVKSPPNILVTTPESLYILLTSESGRASLSTVHTVIVDEIHAIASDKRGAHLAVSLERLDRLVTQAGRRAPVRIGLSATQKPMERIARQLVGTVRPMPRIVDSGLRKSLDIAIEIPDDELSAVASLEQMGRVFDRIAELVQQHRSTIVFVGTRRMTERVAAALEERLGEDAVVAHHGSMSRAMRLLAEQKLKAGDVRCAVATASLELGIDVGAVELVVQIGSPRAIATFVQRVGRAAHHVGGTPKGRLFATTRDQLVECGALVRAVRQGQLDEIILREAPLDIAAQQLVAMVAAEGELAETDAYALLRRTTQYANLSAEQFAQLVTLLTEGASERRHRMGAHLHRDSVAGVLRARRGARLAAIVNGGAIPDNANYAVVLQPEQTKVGEVDEDFAIDSMAGDIFQLGNAAWKIQRIEAGRVLVEDAAGQPPSLPHWFGEAPARTKELSDAVSDLRGEVDQRLTAGDAESAIAAWVHDACAMSQGAATQLVAYLTAGRTQLGVIPRRTVIVAERFFDDGGGMQLVIHSPLGARVNRAWGLALRKRFCRSFNFELQAAATDDGILISLGQPHSFPLESVFSFLPSSQATEVLVQALLDQPMFEIRWRWNATRSLAVLRRQGGKKVAPHLVRMRAADLLSVVFPQAQACLETVVGDREIPDHPLVAETVRDCLTEALDGAGLTALLEAFERGDIQVVGRDTQQPSVLSHELIQANPFAFLDDAGLEDRRTRALQLPRGLPTRDEAPMTDAEAQAHVEAALRPTPRDADELHDVLLGLCLVRPTLLASWEPRATTWLHALEQQGRVARFAWNLGEQWHEFAVPIERWPLVRALVPTAVVPPTLANVVAEIDAARANNPLDTAALWCRVVAGTLDISGPRTARELATTFGVEPTPILGALLALEADGAILRVPSPSAPRAAAAALVATTEGLEDMPFCDRRVLARIHRAMIDRLRRDIEPVSAAAFMRFLLRWQRATRSARLWGQEGLVQIIQQLQGYETAAGAWEAELLPARLTEYAQTWLDQLCFSGELVWFRASPREGQGDDDDARRSVPTKAAPLTIAQRHDAVWLRAHSEITPDANMSAAAKQVYARLADGGATFLAELVRDSGMPALDVEDALWELVSMGLATADGFASLRALISRKRGVARSSFDRGRSPGDTQSGSWLRAVNTARARDHKRPTHAARSLPSAAGRWSRLPPANPADANADAWAKQLLQRYGIVFRDLVVRESNLPPWRDILLALRRLEARGEIRGGRFVTGFVGEQYALPEAADEVRRLREPPPVAEAVVVSACDPLNLVGILSPGARLPAVLGNAVLFVDGVAVATREAGDIHRRPELAAGALVDDNLAYHPPQPKAMAQLSLDA